MKQKSIIIYAKTENDIIGYNGKLPWISNKNDMQSFRRLTVNNIVVMGSGTYSSIDYKPLKNRINIVVSSTMFDNKRYLLSNINRTDIIKYISQYGVFAYKEIQDDNDTELYFVDTFDNAELLAKEFNNKDVFYIGGVNIFKEAYNICDQIYETTFLYEFKYYTGIVTEFNIRKLDKRFNDIWENCGVIGFTGDVINGIPAIEIREYHHITFDSK